jgi:hypothetical protein
MQDMLYKVAKGYDLDAQPWRAKSIYTQGFTPEATLKG